MDLITQLRENICDLPEFGIMVDEISGDIIQQHLPPHIQYACRYWLNHFQCGYDNPIEPEAIHTIRGFLEHNLLHWLEVLSLIGDAGNAVLMVIALEETLKVGCNTLLYRRVIIIVEALLTRTGSS